VLKYAIAWLALQFYIATGNTLLMYQRPGIWWASDEHHGLHRLGSQHLNSNSVVEFMQQQALHMHQNLHARRPRLHPDIKPHPREKRVPKRAFESKAGEGNDDSKGQPSKPELQDGVIVAQYMYVTGGAANGQQGATELMTEYLDSKALETLMFERTKEHDGIIQQFVEPPGDCNSTIRARWSVSAIIIEQSTSRAPLTSLQLAVPLRAATFDAKAGDSIIEPVRSSHVKQCITALVTSIVAAVRRTLPHVWSLFGLDLFFKMSASDGAVLFMFCANARVVHHSLIQPLNPGLTPSDTLTPPSQLRLMAVKENTCSRRKLLDGFFDCPRCKRIFSKSKELSFKVSFRHIILAQMLRAPHNKPASRAASPSGGQAMAASQPTQNQQQQNLSSDDDDENHDKFVASASPHRRVGGRIRPSSASRGGTTGSRPDSANLQLRQLGVMWQQEDLLTMQPWALEDSVKELQRRLKLKSLQKLNCELSMQLDSSSSAEAARTSVAAAAPFLPTWELQQLPPERLTAFQRAVSQFIALGLSLCSSHSLCCRLSKTLK
jgi:uncharacterized C2H2 Zn-finger protein